MVIHGRAVAFFLRADFSLKWMYTVVAAKPAKRRSIPPKGELAAGL
jgi:hypothetical protein